MAGGVKHAQAARLLMQYRTSLYAFILAAVRNHADTEDILQTVSVAVIESIGQLQHESGFLPWAREIARRRIHAHRRTAHRMQSLDPELILRLAEAAERVEYDQPSEDRRAALLACLGGLPDDSRRILSRRYSGQSAEQLATAFGRSVQGVYALIKRIKQALRECVARRLASEPIA
ncbi:MAG: sigma-70 family RNA polymerase sigma factor [Gemmataceae bacterium]